MQGCDKLQIYNCNFLRPEERNVHTRFENYCILVTGLDLVYLEGSEHGYSSTHGEYITDKLNYI